MPPVPATTILPVEDPPANNDNIGMKFEDVENYMVKKVKKESLELV